MHPSCFLLTAALFTGLMPQPGLAETPATRVAEAPAVKLQISTADFPAGGFIPDSYTCRGGLLLPPQLSLSGAPAKTKSLAILVEDPDAVRGTFTHWIAFNIPAGTKNVIAGRPKVDGKDLYLQGKNDGTRDGYIAPCPRPGTGLHRYFFKVYALDTVLDLPPNVGKDEFKKALEGHILAEGELLGKVQAPQ